MRIGGARVRPLCLGVVAAALTLAAGRTEAQLGLRYGYGGGYGPLFNLNYQPPVVNYLNQRSLQNASRATMGPMRTSAYANNPNSYIFHLHDDGFLDRYDVGTRREIEARIGRFSDGPPPSRLASRPRAERPTVVRPSPQTIAPEPRPLPGNGAGGGQPRASRPDAPRPRPAPAPVVALISA